MASTSKDRDISSFFKTKKTQEVQQTKKPTAVDKAQVEKPRPEPSKEERELDFLRRFDLDYTYGPCIGVSRRVRWLRADKFGLSPPKEVLILIEDHEDDVRTEETDVVCADEERLGH